MLPSVLCARDLLMREGGTMYPDAATMFIEACEDEDARLAWWHDVHGLDLSCLKVVRLV